ncbi:MAG: hypothetical protein GY786_21040 [Proteobacteria bacterium]|nr:hypothetical protein [Pseudomonadota bacterium]
MQEIEKHFSSNSGVGVIGIQTTFEGFYTNNFSALKDIAQEYRLTIPLGHNGWSGTPSPVMKRYETRGTPWVVIIDRQGTIRASHFHYDHVQSIGFMEELLKEK